MRTFLVVGVSDYEQRFSAVTGCLHGVSFFCSLAASRDALLLFDCQGAI